MLFASLALAAPLAAPIDVFPGDPAALQNAIDAAPPGATILVHGGTYDPITIDKPLDIIAEPRASLTITGACPFVTAEALVTLAGPGSGRTTLNNFGVAGFVDGFFFCGDPDPLVVGGGFDEFWLVDSTLSAGWCCLTGAAPGAPAIRTTVPTLVVAGSSVAPLDADTDGFPGFPQPVGIDAPTSTVIVTHSTVRGGSYLTYVDDFCTGTFPTGAPAIGIVANLLFTTGSEVSGGAETFAQCPFGSTIVGSHPEADAYDANIATDIFANLTPLNAPLRGSAWDLETTTSGSGGFLFINFDTEPVEFKPGLGWDFLTVAETFQTVVVPPGFGVQSFPIPDLVDLVGFELALELLDFDIGLLGGPVIAQIR